ncbi:peptidoglycan recognition protein [Nocardioides sp. LS1]|uniref:peptidoglycan recognition protein family protein n=1 Tax=Nocardioides sp. LS1 TaxID=1027620 RepID=UPI000F624543|nr:peptidoglycan recognition protein [Nocardioides sp. LS1]
MSGRASGARAAAALVMAAGLALPVPVGAHAAGKPHRPPEVLLRSVGDSGVREADVRLRRSDFHDTTDGADGDRRTKRLRTSSYRLAGLTWRGDGSSLMMRNRAGSGWSAWHPMPALSDLPSADSPDASATSGTEPLWVGGSDAVQIGLHGPIPQRLTLVLIDPGRRKSDSAEPEPTNRTGHHHWKHAPRPPIRLRKAWGAVDSWRNGGPWYVRTIQQVHIHHTVTANRYSRADVPALIRGMYRYHTHNLGWSDIGYNFLVDRFGRIWEGRKGGAGLPVQGAHTLGFNETSTGIAAIGNFELVKPSQKMLTAIVRLASWKLDKYHRDVPHWAHVFSHGSDRFRWGRTVVLPRIDGHRDTNQTACPGRRLYAKLPGIRRRATIRVRHY